MIKATIVLLAAHIVIPLLTRRSAAERHALWTATLAIAAMLPLLTWLLPSWEPAWAQRAADVWPAAFESRSAADSAGDIVIRATAIEADPWTFVSIVPWVWLAGCAILLSTLTRQALRLRRLTASGVEASAQHHAIAARVAGELALAAPRLTCSDQVRLPLAWGVRHAHILLPRSSQDWPDDRMWVVCAHEMAHIARGDWIAHLLAEIACRVYWFNPLFWIARDRMNRDS